jgi:3-hydroxyacyl-CoA dehydrogenase/enoyl-CoA hydratase/3-hydroxybutyryl-CoA epimerase
MTETGQRFGDAWRLERREQGIRILWLDRPGAAENSLDRRSLVELGVAAEAVAKDEDARVLAIRSGKAKGFCVGADLNPLRKGLSSVELKGLARIGLEAFDRLEKLAVPTVAVINGVCQGGGLELALACRDRFVVENSGAMLGIPAVKLNLVAVWGGLERLPRLVGMTRALDLLVSGRSIDDAEANRIGLVDAIVAPARLDIELAHIATRPDRIEPAPWPPEGAREEVAALRKRVRAGNDEHRRAREVMLDAVEADLTKGRERARDITVDGLASQARTREAREAIEHFFTRPGRTG